jgi:hypothetical protein
VLRNNTCFWYSFWQLFISIDTSVLCRTFLSAITEHILCRLWRLQIPGFIWDAKFEKWRHSGCARFLFTSRHAHERTEPSENAFQCYIFLFNEVSYSDTFYLLRRLNSFWRCDLETSRMRRPWPALGCCARGKEEEDYVFIRGSRMYIYRVTFLWLADDFLAVLCDWFCICLLQHSILHSPVIYMYCTWAHVRALMGMCARTHTHTHTNTHVYAYEHIHTHTHPRTRTRTYMHAYVLFLFHCNISSW